ncbi:hypothetical protein [Streptomyces sp. NPDC021212]
MFGLSVVIAFAAQAANRLQAGFAEIGGAHGSSSCPHAASGRPPPKQ